MTETTYRVINILGYKTKEEVAAMEAATLKKIFIRLLIVEVIFSLMALAVTPFLFGSIKPFNPKIKSSNSVQSRDVDYSVALAVKKAEVKKPALKAVKKNSKQRTMKPVKSRKRIKKANEAPVEEPKRTIQPIGEPIIIGE